MKQALKSALGAAAFLLLTGMSFSQSQSTQTAVAVSSLYNGAIRSDRTDSLAETPPKLKTAFTALFPAAVQQRWTRMDKGYYVSFVSNGRKSSAGFGVDGTLNYVISDCSAEQLPESFRNEIHKNYSGYKLFSGLEIQAYSRTSYQVVLEGNKEYITLKYTDEGIEKTQQITKSLL